MLHFKKTELQVKATKAATQYKAHGDDIAFHSTVLYAVEQYAESGVVKHLTACAKAAWGTSASDYKFVTEYIRTHVNARKVKNATPAKYVKAKKPEQIKACRGKWYTPMHKECGVRKVAQAKRKAEYKMDLTGEFAKFITRAERYVRDEKTTDAEHAARIVAEMKKLQAELAILLES